MTTIRRSTLVFAIVAATGVSIWSACGSDNPATVADMGGSAGSGGSPEPDAASGAGGDSGSSATAGSAGTATGGGGMGGSGGVDSDAAPDVAMTPTCVEKAKCTNGPDPGLCAGGSCVACVDVTGDPACVAAYGAGYLCIGGACIRAQCRVAGDCGDAGNKTCVNASCMSTACHSDAECTDVAKPICDLPSGNCVAADTACAAKAAGDVCAGAGSKHLCCGASLTCKAIDCCTDGQCPVGQTCSALGSCANPSCPTVADHTYYVDAADPGTNGRTGSSACPFKSLLQARAFVTNPLNPENASFPVTIILRSGISEANEGVGAFPIYIPVNIRVQGASDTTRPVVTVPDGATGFIFNYPKPTGSQAFGGVSQLTITQTTAVTDDTKQGYGIQVTGTHPDVNVALNPNLNIDISRVAIQKFRNGIRVDTGGYVGLGLGTSLTGNYIGLTVNNGYVHAVGSVASPSHFDDNFHSGIYVSAASILNVDGAPLGDGGASGKTITADRNNYGIRFLSFGTVPTGLSQTIQDAQMNANSKFDPTTATTGGAGLYAYAGGNPFKVRSCLFTNNYRGVYVSSDSGATSPNDLSGIDLGGQNTFAGGSTNTLLCVGIASITGAMTLNAINNKWNGKDCATATVSSDGGSSVWLKTASDCISKLDVGGMGTANTLGHVNVKNCALMP